MNSNIFWLLISFLYIGCLVLIAYFFYRVCKWKSELVRKFIHIFTSNWIFIVMYKIEDPYVALLGPFVFIFVNAVFVYGGFGKYLGMADRKRDNGLIYYPLSIFILVLLHIKGIISTPVVIASVLLMGWGDGFAAIIGTYFGSHRYKVYDKYKKSVEGSLTMFVVSFIAIIAFVDISLPRALAVAFIAMILENVTPLGFDNITVPLLCAGLLEVLCRV